MKTICLILILAITMTTYSQNTTPPSPPKPPIVNASTTHSGITHAKSETESSYAFSCVFDTALKDEIMSIISKEFKDFSKDDLGKKYTKKVDNDYYYNIEMKVSELKLEYEFKGKASDEISEISKKFNVIEEAILAL